MFVDEIELLTGLHHTGLRPTLQAVASRRGKVERQQGISQLKRLVGAGVWKHATANVRQRCQTNNTVQPADKLRKRQHASLPVDTPRPFLLLDVSAPDRNHCTTCKHLDPACSCTDEAAAVDTPLPNLPSCFISIAPLVSKTVLPVPLAKRKRCSPTTQKFRDWDAKKQKLDKNGTQHQSFRNQNLRASVPMPFRPLDASSIPAYHDGISYYSVVLPIVQQYRNLFTEDGVMVLTELFSMMAGISKQDTWIKNTQPNHGSGRHYDDELFCKADRMEWVYNITDYLMARQLENDAMKAIVAVFQFTAHQDPSCVHRKAVSSKVPHVGYFMPIRPYSGTRKQFPDQKDDIKDNTSNFKFADLGRRFDHPFGWKKA